MNRRFLPLIGMAMVLVVLHHTIQMQRTLAEQLGIPFVSGAASFLVHLLLALGYFAVPTFLFISGSFFAYAATGREGRGLTYRIVYSNLRIILVPYVVWSLVYYLYFQDVQAYTLRDYVVNLIVGRPFHFIPLLAFFYLVSPLLARLRLRQALITLVFIAAYQTLLIVMTEPETFGISFPESVGLLVPRVLGPTLADWAIYFPLGFILSRYAKALKTHLERWGVFLGIGALVLFAVFFLGSLPPPYLVWARHIMCLLFTLTLPVIPARMIPFQPTLTHIGKHVYGIYLTHMLLIDLILLGIQVADSRVLNYPLLLMPLLFAAALLVPLKVMEMVSKSQRARRFYRFAFG